MALDSFSSCRMASGFKLWCLLECYAAAIELCVAAS